MKSIATVVAAICALPFAALAENPPMPRVFQGMQKGQWKVEMLENSTAKKGESMPTMTICSDNLLKHSKENSQAKSERRCKMRLLKDASDEAVVENTCPDHTSTTTIKRQSSKVVLMDMKSSGKEGPSTVKMRYTNLGACSAGQPTMTLDKNSEQCKKMQASAAKMDPAKDCAGAGAQRAQCEQMIRQHITQMRAMCS
jgi:hypothetical protein